MRIALIFFCFLIILSCKDSESYLPKPRTYPKINYPKRDFVNYHNNECPFSSTIPKYAQYLKDSLKTINENRFSCWFDLYVSELNAYMHFSYVDFSSRARFDELVQDAFEMADKHNTKANYRDEIGIRFPDKNVYGLIFEIDGPVASPFQFYLTDSLQHFLRGSLYFNSEVNRDSIQPIYDFIKKDFEPFFQDFEWEYN